MTDCKFEKKLCKIPNSRKHKYTLSLYPYQYGTDEIHKMGCMWPKMQTRSRTTKSVRRASAGKLWWNEPFFFFFKIELLLSDWDLVCWMGWYHIAIGYFFTYFLQICSFYAQTVKLYSKHWRSAIHNTYIFVISHIWRWWRERNNRNQLHYVSLWKFGWLEIVVKGSLHINSKSWLFWALSLKIDVSIWMR